MDGWKSRYSGKDDTFSLGSVDFVVLDRTFGEKYLAYLWIERSSTQKKYEIFKSWRGSKKLFYVLKTLDLKPSTESTVVVVKMRTLKTEYVVLLEDKLSI